LDKRSVYESTSQDGCDWASLPVFGRGTATFTFHVLSRTPAGTPAEVGVRIQGIVELTSGGRAQVLNTAQVHVEEDGIPRVHLDHFVIRPIGG
jgi:hypothetical protein